MARGVPVGRPLGPPLEGGRRSRRGSAILPGAVLPACLVACVLFGPVFSHMYIYVLCTVRQRWRWQQRWWVRRAWWR